MGKTVPRKYTDEFKEEAIKLSLVVRFANAFTIYKWSSGRGNHCST